jgi:3-methyladenine DNA glycosylase AlkD
MSHVEILKEIKKYERKNKSAWPADSYLGSTHKYYEVSVPVRRKIAKEWSKKHADISYTDFVSVIDALTEGESHEEKTISAMLLANFPEFRKKIATTHAGLKLIDGWLDQFVGWAEVDSFCQNTFKVDEVLPNWNAWEVLVRKLSKSGNINKRRAALVLLVGPAHYSSDQRILNLSFEIIDSLKHEKPILITKAISWLLRSVVDQHKKEVEEYIKLNIESLPKIAIRETVVKIKTGTKNKSKRK